MVKKQINLCDVAEIFEKTYRAINRLRARARTRPEFSGGIRLDDWREVSEKPRVRARVLASTCNV